MRRRALLVAAGGTLIGLSLLVGPAVTAQPSATDQVVTWTGNGAGQGGTCSNLEEGLTGVPAGEQGWLFILTSPGSSPWTLTATFANAGTLVVDGTQEGNGAVHFVLDTPTADTLQSASATNGTANSVLTISGCTVNGSATGPGGGGTTTTTTSTTTTSTTTTTTEAGLGTTTTTSTSTPGRPGFAGGGGSLTSGTSGTLGQTSGVSGGTTSATTGTTRALAGATTVHTGEPWSGSRPYELAVAALGALMVMSGLLLRRRRATG